MVAHDAMYHTQCLSSFTKIQWQWPETQGEKNFVVVLGGLHIEMTALGAFGRAFASGTADSFLKASHVSRTRHAHQVTACSLHILMSRAYDEYVEGLSESDTKLEFHQWQDYKSSSRPQFKYWSMVLKVRSYSFYDHCGRADSASTKNLLEVCVLGFFALDKVNYARWLTVHLHDMIQLDQTCPRSLKRVPLWCKRRRGNFLP